MINDPIADMLTRIRNANALKYEYVSMPSSKMKIEIAKIMYEEGFISEYKVSSPNKDLKSPHRDLTIKLRYGIKGEKVIRGLKRISKPGLRVTVAAEKMPYVLKGLGVAIISTSKGLVTDRKARSLGVGGEILAYIW
jgi:small subunit ribosomal protein S8